MNKESLVREKRDFQSIGEEISHELAAKMVKNHQDVHSEESYSYYVGKNVIDQILAQPGCVGMRFFDAINEVGEKTLVYAGIDEKGNTIIEITSVNDHGKIVVTPGMLGDKSAVGPTWSWID